MDKKVRAEKPGIEKVRQFWNDNPLFVGESRYSPGERDFFEEHRRTSIWEHSGSLSPIFTRDVRPGKKILDAGCGIGFWVQELSELGGDIQACDISETSIKITDKRIKLYGLRASIVVANVECLPYQDESFEHINCQGVIHHTPDTAACIREFNRILKPGGTACLSVYYEPLYFSNKVLFRMITWMARVLLHLHGRGREDILKIHEPAELVRMYDGKDNPIGKAYSRRALQDLTQGYFHIIESIRTGFPRRAFVIPLPDRIHRFLSRHFGLMIVFRCVKI